MGALLNNCLWLLAACVLYQVNGCFNAWLARRRLKQLNRCGDRVMYRHKDLIFGTDFSNEEKAAMINGTPSRWRRDLYTEYGKTFFARTLGTLKMYTMDLKNIKTIFALDADNYLVEPLRIPAMAPWVGKGIFTTDGSVWRHSRDLIKPIFARAQISNLEAFSKHVDRLFETLPPDGTAVDLQPLFMRMYLDHSTEFLFGECANTLGTSVTIMDAEAFIKSFDDALRGVGKYMITGPWLTKILRAFDRQFEADCRDSQVFVDRAIQRAVERRQRDTIKDNSPGSFSFIDELLDQTEDRVYLRDQLLNIFFPARDSSAIGISLIFFQLARHPEVWNKLRAEAKANTEALSFERLKAMKYLQGVLNEALRLYAPAASAIRICGKDAVLPHGGGPNGDESLLVPRGTIVRGDWDMMHRDPDVWGPDADKFKPERWEHIKPQWEYIPFMGGPRICPAQQWILTQYAYMLARFAEKFERLENLDPVPELVEEIRLTRQSRNGVKVAFVRE